MRKYILVLASCMLAFILQSCFQDMDHPAFDYPESNGEQVNSPLRLYLPFNEGDIRDKGEYGFLVADNGNAKFVPDGINGMAYQGSKDAYVLAKTPSSLSEEIPNLGSCTVAFWMKSTRNVSAQGIFSIPNSTQFWGNFDIYLENTGSETEAFFKIHFNNCTSETGSEEKTIDARIENVFGTEWVNMAFVYDGTASVLTVYRNGESVLTNELAGFGNLKFKDVGKSLVIGAFQFSTDPVLTSATTKPDWADNFHGQLDQFRFYGEAMSAADIKKLYESKE